MRRREVRLLKRQIELPLCGRDLTRLSRQRTAASMPSGFNTRSTSVPTALSERKPPKEMHRGAMVDESAPAIIAPRFETIADIHFAAAMTTA